MDKYNKYLDARLRWGTYHPNLLGGVSEAKTNPLVMRMIIFYKKVEYYNIKDLLKFENFR